MQNADEQPSTPGWHPDPTDPSRERYWDQRWTKQTRGSEAVQPDTVSGPQRTPAPAVVPSPTTSAPAPDPKVFRLRRALAAAGIIVSLGVVAFIAWKLVFGNDSPEPRPENRLEGLTYTFVSPQVPCCSTQRTEGTSEFTVEGPWRVEWRLDGEGEPCSVLGRVVDPASNRFAELEPFGSGQSGEHEYQPAGTFSIMLQYDCPEESIATAQVRVFQDGV